VLGEVAARVVAQLSATPSPTLGELVARLAAQHGGADPDRVEADTRGFLGELLARGLLEVDPP
jgi:hypothetical protein